jgi:DNA-binding NarL/FixJ family response regulator
LAAAPTLARTDTLVARLAQAPPTGPPTHPAGLSAREVEVLRLLVAGMSNPEIAAALFISSRTVTTHVSNIFAKLGVESRTAATRVAIERELL